MVKYKIIDLSGIPVVEPPLLILYRLLDSIDRKKYDYWIPAYIEFSTKNPYAEGCGILEVEVMNEALESEIRRIWSQEKSAKDGMIKIAELVKADLVIELRTDEEILYAVVKFTEPEPIEIDQLLKKKPDLEIEYYDEETETTHTVQIHREGYVVEHYASGEGDGTVVYKIQPRIVEKLLDELQRGNLTDKQKYDKVRDTILEYGRRRYISWYNAELNTSGAEYFYD